MSHEGHRRVAIHGFSHVTFVMFLDLSFSFLCGVCARTCMGMCMCVLGTGGRRVTGWGGTSGIE